LYINGKALPEPYVARFGALTTLELHFPRRVAS